MDHGGGGGRSSSRLRERLARMFRPGSLLRSTCNTNASTCSSSSTAPGAGASKPPPSSACSSSRALLAADADVACDRDSFLASSRRDYASLVGRTESFSTAIDRLHRRSVVAPAPPSRFSVDAPPLLEKSNKEEKGNSPREYTHHHRLHGVKNDKANMKLLSNPYGFSSSDDNDADTDGADVFSSEADDLGGRSGAKKLGESAETFFSSSRSFSSDSSEFYTKKKKKKQPNKKSPASSAPKPPLPPPPPRAKRGHQRRHRRAASSCDTCGVRDGFRPVVSAAEEQVRKGFAVVKRSRDPYADFRSSMVEMIVGRQMFGAPELERLLRSYLSLNAPRHHPVILQAFSDIWVVLHGG
ncbi:transcription repressor OFP4-like [Phragmites australis]|uniref:transcription repressor OFP4-like n=1 Tax=Phragmites australis TaxID=29695 RepID=UPI002D77C7F1|nr:transcription repressor OFP4-like [Phragmites australis]